LIVLDTNVISELAKLDADPRVERWFRAQPVSVLYLCDIVVMEQAYGGQRFFLKTGSERYSRNLTDILQRYKDRVLPLTREAAIYCGKLRAQRESIGRPISVQDAMIVAICIFHGAALATRNVKDFEGLDLRLVNPFEGA
jgi:predicted nucleic acid-binding protein